MLVQTNNYCIALKFHGLGLGNISLNKFRGLISYAKIKTSCTYMYMYIHAGPQATGATPTFHVCFQISCHGTIEAKSQWTPVLEKMATFEIESGYHVLYRMRRFMQLLQTVRIYVLLLSRPHSSQCYRTSRNLSGTRTWELHSRIVIIGFGKEVEDGHCRRDKWQNSCSINHS